MKFAGATNLDRKSGAAQWRDLLSPACGKLRGEMALQKSPWMRGPEGRPLNFSPAREGWESIPKMI
jgi:hypothetical protein